MDFCRVPQSGRHLSVEPRLPLRRQRRARSFPTLVLAECRRRRWCYGTAKNSRRVTLAVLWSSHPRNVSSRWCNQATFWPVLAGSTPPIRITNGHFLSAVVGGLERGDDLDTGLRLERIRVGYLQ